MNTTKSWNHQKPSNTWIITQPEEHRDLLPQLVGPGKGKSANEITSNVMNIHDVIIIRVLTYHAELSDWAWQVFPGPVHIHWHSPIQMLCNLSQGCIHWSQINLCQNYNVLIIIIINNIGMIMEIQSRFYWIIILQIAKKHTKQAYSFYGYFIAKHNTIR